MNGESGKVLFKVEVAGMAAELGSINETNAQLVLNLLGKGKNGLLVSLTLLRSSVEDVTKRKLGSHVSTEGLRGDLTSGSDRGPDNGKSKVVLVKIKVLTGRFSIVNRGSIEEIRQDNKGRERRNTERLGKLSIVRETNIVLVVKGVGNSSESSIGLLVVSETNNGDGTLRLELLKVLLGNLSARGEQLLLHVLDNILSGSTALVLRLGVKRLENVQGGVALDLVLGTKSLVLLTVDLDKGNVLVFKLSGSDLVLGSKTLAMTAPGCKELSEDKRVFLDELVKFLSRLSTEVRDIGGP